MSEDEVSARIAVLEAVVYTLIESVALQAAGERGMAGVNQVVETISYAVGERLSEMPPAAKEMAHAHFVALLQTLQDRLAPSQSGPVN